MSCPEQVRRTRQCISGLCFAFEGSSASLAGHGHENEDNDKASALHGQARLSRLRFQSRSCNGTWTSPFCSARRAVKARAGPTDATPKQRGKQPSAQGPHQAFRAARRTPRASGRRPSAGHERTRSGSLVREGKSRSKSKLLPTDDRSAPTRRRFSRRINVIKTDRGSGSKVRSSGPSSRSSIESVEQDFAAFYCRYRADVLRFCRRIVRDDHTAEDMTQETFVRALRRFGALDSRRGAWPWLSTIARNTCIDRLRTRANGELPDDPLSPTESSSPDATWEEVRRRYELDRTCGELSAALQSVSPRERRILILKTVRNLSWAQIAQLEGTTQDSVRNLAFRARKVLRPLLAEARRELNLPVFLPLWLRLKARAGRARAWAAGRVPIAPRGWGVALADPLGAILIGCLAVGAAWATPVQALAAVQSRAAVANSSQALGLNADDLAAQGATPSQSQIDDGQARRMSMPGLRASVDTGPTHEGSVGPSEGQIVVELIVPGTNTVVFRSEPWFNCDTPGADLLPQQGPIRSVC